MRSLLLCFQEFIVVLDNLLQSKLDEAESSIEKVARDTSNLDAALVAKFLKERNFQVRFCRQENIWFSIETYSKERFLIFFIQHVLIQR
jgi:hypothetical protein